MDDYKVHIQIADDQELIEYWNSEDKLPKSWFKQMAQDEAIGYMNNELMRFQTLEELEDD